jgi:CheY-like chemotaxis protein
VRTVQIDHYDYFFPSQYIRTTNDSRAGKAKKFDGLIEAPVKFYCPNQFIQEDTVQQEFMDRHIHLEKWEIADMSKACVMVVEDEQDFLDLLKQVLEGEGFYVAAASDGEQALELLKNFRPAVIVTDIMMPKMNGLELIEQVRKRPELEHIPIIAASAAHSGVLTQAQQAGANETIRKPLDFDELVEILNRYMPTHAPISETTDEDNS